MIISSLRVRNFRAHADSSLDFSGKINVITGPNGAGKTNLLESVHYLCLTKSFLTSTDRYAVRNGSDHFDIEGEFRRQSGVENEALTEPDRDRSTVRLTCMAREGKKLFVNGAPMERMTEIVGRYPIVIHSPEDYVLTSEGPEQRRRFLNNVLSQARPLYLADLLQYRRTIRQRNSLLARRTNLSTLESWTEELVTTGARVVHARRAFVQRFGSYLAEAYSRLAEIAEEPTVEYRTIDRDQAAVDVDAIAECMRSRINELRQLELERGRTLVGPHHDELVFRLDGLEVRRYGSQGQHRTFAMALKLAQYFYLRDQLDDLPVLLLDDAFAHLDQRRTDGFLELLASDAVGQSIITAASDHYFDNRVDPADSRNRFLSIQGGIVHAAAIA